MATGLQLVLLILFSSLAIFVLKTLTKGKLLFASKDRQKAYAEYMIHKGYIYSKYQDQRQLPSFNVWEKMSKKYMDLEFIDDYFSGNRRGADWYDANTFHYTFPEYGMLAVATRDDDRMLLFFSGSDWRLVYRLKFVNNLSRAIYLGEGLYFEGNPEQFENTMSIIKLKAS
jgi:hypothetical protein